MSNEIKEKCETVTVTREHAHPCWIGPDDQPECTYTVDEKECGLKLEEAERKDRRLEAIVATAQRTGIPSVLSKTDVLEKVVEDAVFSEVLNLRISECAIANNLALSVHCTTGQEPRSRVEAKAEVKKKGVADILARLPQNQRAAIEKEAERFMKDAKAVIAKRRVGK